MTATLNAMSYDTLLMIACEDGEEKHDQHYDIMTLCDTN